ncbi:hypothetical protein THASP1DRAFT_32047 [Thamnocephalis sphaerospora]|uniref:Uncharacterized protein n=1 Tax=Thamnocephalis sphaerospora TaxID=78915 RepID=A0A4P9XK51_9FUNG|nr:hypothetical protein THASP1DRAFT_32047 [Thamnocephalis sphaerospora]|eukprot:RKP06135.1 hypothetical protein THASP1DRAFT_32047 [Thamnocephalis sphaerospora]
MPPPSERQLALEATVAFRLKQYERAAILLRELNARRKGADPLVAHNLAVAECFLPLPPAATTSGDRRDDGSSVGALQSLEHWQRLVPDNQCPAMEGRAVAAYNRALAYFYMGRPRQGLKELATLVVHAKQMGQTVAMHVVLLAADTALRTWEVGLAETFLDQVKRAVETANPSGMLNPKLPETVLLVTRLFRTRLLLVRGNIEAAAAELEHAPSPAPPAGDGEDDQCYASMIAAFWSLRAQVAAEQGRIGVARDLLDLVDRRNDVDQVMDLNGHACINFLESKYHLAGLLFKQASALVEARENTFLSTPPSDASLETAITRGHQSADLFSIREALEFNQCMFLLYIGELEQVVCRVEARIMQYTRANEIVPSILWLLLGSAVVQAILDDCKSVTDKPGDTSTRTSFSRIVTMLIMSSGEQLDSEAREEPLDHRSAIYAALCFDRFLWTILVETEKRRMPEKLSDIANVVNDIDSDYRMPYAYGLLARSWCELIAGRWRNAARLLAPLTRRSDEWLAGPEAKTPAVLLAATRISVLSNIYYGWCLCLAGRQHDSCAKLVGVQTWTARDTTAAGLAACFAKMGKPAPRVFQPDVLFDRNLLTTWRCCRQQFSAQSLFTYHACMSMASGESEPTPESSLLLEAQKGFELYKSLQFLVPPLDAQTVGASAIDHRLGESARELEAWLQRNSASLSSFIPSPSQ